MRELAWLAGAFALGCAGGMAYFVALWATVRVLPAARNPAWVVVGSFVVRFGLAGTMFFLIVRVGGLPWIASALAGFILARLVVVRRLLPSDASLSEDGA